MGQFYSREFDGDPYIDLMRAIPEREITWWVQKVIWLAEGFTFADHFARTYPSLFEHKCARCKGAGMLTCPGCQGLKKQKAALSGLQVSDSISRSRLPGASQDNECQVCGGGCGWDHESEWEGKWEQWESRLAYYDRTYGPLMDEWYEDVLNAGNLEEDTAPADDEGPPPGETGVWAEDDRELKKDRKRYEALLKRYGHPYEADRMLGYAVVDPTASVGANLWNLNQVNNSLPTELNPLNYPKLLKEGPGGRLGQFYNEVNMEVVLMQNLDAAVRGRPKPHRLGPSAGTVACPECDGAAWNYSFIPNAQVLFRTEQPYWATTLQQLNRFWYTGGATGSNPADPTGRLGQQLGGEWGLRSALKAAQPLTPEALVGAPPESTQRYRSELELLLAHPELRSSRVRLLSTASRLPRELWEGEEEQGEEGAGTLEATATPLQAPAPAANGNTQQKQGAPRLMGSSSG